MVSPKKLIKMARKWQRLATLNRKRVSLPRSDQDANTSRSNMSLVADKGHFVVYTADKRRFMFPVSYLTNQVFKELLVMSEEEFGLSSNRPIILPCDAAFMEYVVSLIELRVDREIEQALLISIAISRCTLSYCPHKGESNQQLLVCSF